LAKLQTSNCPDIKILSTATTDYGPCKLAKNTALYGHSSCKLLTAVHINGQNTIWKKHQLQKQVFSFSSFCKRHVQA